MLSFTLSILFITGNIIDKERKMITLKIGNEERKGGNIEERWITRQIRKRKKDGTPICVQANIKKGIVNINLSSAACSGSSGGGGRQPNRKEQKLIGLWNKKGLNGQEINPGMVISFLNQLSSI